MDVVLKYILLILYICANLFENYIKNHYLYHNSVLKWLKKYELFSSYYVLTTYIINSHFNAYRVGTRALLIFYILNIVTYINW